MKEMNMMKESYERSALIITSFAKEDVIVTSGNPLADDLLDLIGDNDTIIAPDGDGAKSYRVHQNR